MKQRRRKTPKPIEPEILRQDEHWLAVHKPAGMLTVSGRNNPVVSLRQWLAERLAGGDFGGVLPVHRIDKDTSGLVVFARTKDAQRHLSMQFQNREVTKSYLAITEGAPIADDGVIEIAIGRLNPTSSKSRIAPNSGKPASTRYEVVERYRGFTLVRCFPKTGRRHQLRLHLQALGCPLAVDPFYNPRGPDKPEGLFVRDFKRGFSASKTGARPVIGRLTLHAHTLDVRDPITDEPTRIECPPPKDFRAAVKQLRKWAMLGQQPKEVEPVEAE